MSLADRATGFGHGAPPKRLELLVAQAFDTAPVLLELLPRRQRRLNGVETWIERTPRRAGVHVDHGCDLLGNSITRRVAGNPRPAVYGEHNRRAGALHRVADRIDVVSEGDRGTVGISRL